MLFFFVTNIPKFVHCACLDFLKINLKLFLKRKTILSNKNITRAGCTVTVEDYGHFRLKRHL